VYIRTIYPKDTGISKGKVKPNQVLISSTSEKTRSSSLASKYNMKILKKFNITSRRLQGLFASIIESGAMVSLAGRWVRESELKFGSTKGLETKVIKYTKDGTEHEYTLYRTASLADLLRGFGWRVIFGLAPNKVKISGRLRVLTLFSGFVYRMYRKHGDVMTVKYLKAAQLALQKAIGKDPINSLTDLDPDVLHSRLTGFGLPTIIPSRDRRLINGGSTMIIRFWLTLFSVYRVISIPGKLKLETINGPSSVTAEQLLAVSRQFYLFLKGSSASTLFNIDRLSRRQDLLLLETASSTKKVSWLGMFSDVHLLDAYKGQSAWIRNILTLTGQPELVLLFDLISTIGPEYPVSVGRENATTGLPGSIYDGATVVAPEGRFLGKLSIKSEAAGKERVFAMVDFWTQQALKPIHEMLFSFLKSLPNDGTFNQNASIKRAGAKALLYGKSYGYDLSAATDRLPIGIQTMLLDLVVPDLGTNWELALTKREYYLYIPEVHAESMGIRCSKKTITKELETNPGYLVPNEIQIGSSWVPVSYNEKGKPWITLTYAVGQPMGALSSWAMLAVTHHLLLQYCYRLAYELPMSTPWTKDTWYTGYELLGDDIIIFDSLVAAEYLRVMSLLGVPINTSKSVCARTAVAEFAKVTMYFGVDVSALSWKMFMSGNSLMGRANTLYYILNKGIVTKNIIPFIERFSRQNRYKVGNTTPTYIALWTMMSNRGAITVEQALAALIDGKTKVFNFAKAILMNADVNKIKLGLPGLILDKGLHLYESRRAKAIWNIEKTWFGIHMWKPLAVFSAKTDVSSDTEVLAKAMWEHLNPRDAVPNEQCTVLELNYGSLEMSFTEPAVAGQVMDPQVNDLRVLYSSLYSELFRRAEHLVKPIVDKPLQIDSPLAELVDGRDTLDRYQELLQLVARAEEKLDPDRISLPARVIRPTELKLVKLLQKMGDRPLFTTAHSLF
jgi:hypothetical protein